MAQAHYVRERGPDGREQFWWVDINGNKTFPPNQKAAMRKFYDQQNAQYEYSGYTPYTQNDNKPVKAKQKTKPKVKAKPATAEQIAANNAAYEANENYAHNYDPRAHNTQINNTKKHGWDDVASYLKDIVSNDNDTKKNGWDYAASYLKDVASNGSVPAAQMNAQAMQRAAQYQGAAQAQANTAQMAAAASNVNAADMNARARNPYGQADNMTAQTAAQAAAATAAGDRVRGRSLAAQEAAVGSANQAGAQNLNMQINRSDSLKQNANQYQRQSFKDTAAAEDARQRGNIAADETMQENAANQYAMQLNLANDTGETDNDTYKQETPKDKTEQTDDDTTKQTQPAKTIEDWAKFVNDEYAQKNAVTGTTGAKDITIEAIKRIPDEELKGKGNEFKAALRRYGFLKNNYGTDKEIESIIDQKNAVSDKHMKSIHQPAFYKSLIHAYGGRT